MTKDRGIGHIPSRHGNILELIEKKIKKKGKVRILDAGCGFGVAMMDFVKKFGNKVEMIGYNYTKKSGDVEKMKQKAINKKIFTKSELNKIKNMPKIYFINASKKLPFKSNSFDFIYSMASIYLYKNKIEFLEECNRILKKNGIARISPGFGKNKNSKSLKGTPNHYKNYWEIWNKGKEIEIQNYCKKIKGVKAIWENKGKGPSYIEIKKQSKLNFKLQFVAAIDFHDLHDKWLGVKSIYTTKKEFKPRW